VDATRALDGFPLSDGTGAVPGRVTEPQERFRETVRAFLNEQVVPEYPVWVREGRPSRRFWEGAGQALIDQAMLRHVSDRLSGSDAAMAKLYCTELQGHVVDRCLNLWDPSDALRGDSHIGNAYLDGRVSRIYGGSSEIMKVIIGQGLGL